MIAKRIRLINSSTMSVKIKTSILIFSVVLFLFTSFVQAGHNDTRVLVVRGGHPYDTPEFEEMCLSLKGIQVDLVLTAHFESLKTAEIEEKYDAILFLNQNKHYPEYERNKMKYMDLTRAGVGMVFLHFTLSSQPEWDEYHDLVGGKWFLKKFTKDESLLSTYFTDLTIEVKVLDKDHPVTEGLEDFKLTDTFYGNIQISSKVHPLLGCDQVEISKTLAWTQVYNNAKLVYIMPGYSKKAYQNASYKHLISNALSYVGSAE